MKDRMQKTSAKANDFPQKARTESEGYEGVQTFMWIWKAWKKPKTRIANLKRCGVPSRYAYQWGYTRLGYWRVALSRLVTSAMSNDKLRRAGYRTLLDTYLEWHPI